MTSPPSRPLQSRPLIICDADEVLLLFIAGLERFMAPKGLYLDLAFFGITGNVKRRDDGAALAAAEVSALIQEFFATAIADLDPAPGAADALDALSAHADIVILTNVPAAHRAARAAHLAGLGMNYPVLANAGPKGPAVAELASERSGPIFFIDDLHPNIASVAEKAAHVTRIHFIADPRLKALAPPSKHAHHLAANWPDAEAFIRRQLAG